MKPNYQKREQNRLEIGLNSGFANGAKIRVNTDLSNKDTIIQVTNVKTSSVAKKTIAHKLESQFNQLATKCDKKPNGFVKRIKAAKV